MKRWLILSTVSALVLTYPLPAASGGGATFDFGSDYLVIGEAVTGRTEVWLGRGRTAGLEDGPFHAYLVPSRTRFPGRGLPEGAMWLAPVSFEPKPGPYATATVTFEVPPVDPGAYSLTVCNAPCTVRSVGDLVGGWFSVAPSPIEARMQSLEDRLRWKVRALRSEINRQEKRPQKDQAELEIRIDDLEQQLAVLDGELDARSRPAAEGNDWPAWTGWAAVASLLVIAMIRRRRNRAVRPPGPEAEWIVPDDGERVTARR
jgi:hypothetical protein